VGAFELVVSPHLLYELQVVLSRQKFRRYLTLAEVYQYVMWLAERAGVSADPPATFAQGFTSDPDDDYLVGLAVLNEASYLVSGDWHLLELGEIPIEESPAVRVRTPREFLEELERPRTG
jgi:putative PIN family toxin of toxin-antitoxin system